jgi:hypothetical protein
LAANQQFDSILKNGWRQGSIASQELALATKLPIEEATQQYYVVVSHSCDLTNPRTDFEPKVELVRADVIESKRPGKRFCRIPRARRQKSFRSPAKGRDQSVDWM